MTFPRPKVVGALSIAALLLAGAAPAGAQDKIERTVLQRTELSGQPARVMVMTELTAEPGARIPRHTHPGTEMVYVLAPGRTRTDGGEIRELTPGQTLRFARREVHGGFTVIGATRLRALTVHVVDAGEPMTTLLD